MFSPLNSAAMIFKDADLQKQFNLYGYVVVPFINAAACTQLRELFFETHQQVPEGFYSSSFSSEEEIKQRIGRQIEAVLDPQVNKTFGNIKKLGSCFLNKAPGAGSQMPIHQDWTVTDEPQFDSVTIWIPLQDVNEQNGAIQVIDGSHRFANALRAPGMPAAFQQIEPEVRKHLKTLPMKAGEAFIFSQALWHASPPNLSNQSRVVVTYGLMDAQAPLKFYYRSSDNEVEVYDTDVDFFKNYNTRIGQRPQGAQLKEVISYQPQFISLAEFHQQQRLFEHKKKEAMYKMKPIFKDAAQQQFFEQEGYAVFPLLTPQEVADLNAYYQSLQLKDEKGYGFYVSMDSSDKNLCRQIRDKIWGMAVPRLSEHLKDFKPFVASFVAKDPNPKGVVPAHQDWSFADKEEEGNSSITCWIALQDTTLDNGTMGVIRGSHKFMQNHRPSPSPQTPVPLSEHMFSIFPYLKVLEMKAGEVLMFDNRTFHASPPNTTNAIRLAAGVGIMQNDANLVHYYMKPDGQFKTLLRYNVDEDFFLKYENATLSRMFDEGKLIEGYGEPVEVPYSFQQYSSEELVEIIKAAGNEWNVPMTEKLALLFGYSGNTKKEEPVVEEQQPAPPPVAQQQVQEQVKDTRTFFQIYTPLNIYREIKHRLVGS